MNNIENLFFEEYKSLDRLCRDLLGTNQGVSEYIEEMNEVSSYDQRKVPSWDNDYKMLKHVRWIRNVIAHGDGESECSMEDYYFVRDFRERILNQEDPFACLERAKKSQRNSNSPVKRNVSGDSEVVNRNNEHASYQKESKSSSSSIIIYAIIILSVIAFLFAAGGNFF